MNNHSRINFPVRVVLATVACGCGMLFLPWLWPELRILGWLLPTVPTLLVLLIGFDHDRSQYAGAAVYKELFARVALLGTVIVVGWVTLLEYVAKDPFIVIAALVSCFVSMALMGAACTLYAIIRRPGSAPRTTFMLCPNCRYRIDNILGPNCPECGRRFAPAPDDWKSAGMVKRAGEAKP